MKGASQQAKEKLEAYTDLAIHEGAFGLPWFMATNAEDEKEGFFGFDHLGHVVDFLGLEKLTPASTAEGQGSRSVMI
jgi:2-hydroxychromene-2-carboxylate isomerase